MILVECIKMAFASIRVNKLRSFLTMLGIIIGISSVILITTIGSTIQNTLGSVFDALGPSCLYVGVTMNDDPENYYLRPQMTEDDMISDDDLNRLAERYPGEYMVLSREILDMGKVKNHDGEFLNVIVNGMTPGFQPYHRIKLLKGRFINDADMEGERYSAVVAESFAERYGGGDQILGKPLTVTLDSGDEYTFYIVGVYEEQIDSGDKLDPDAPSEVMIPYSVVRTERNLSSRTYDFLTIVYNKESGTKNPTTHAREFFNELYRDNPHFTTYVDNSGDVTSMLGSVMAVLTAAFSAIAAISLLVGGIGVMNIMLVSIVERTKEIGIRKAIGAKKAAILFQFVVEAIIICLIGGIMGILFGLGLSFVTGKVMEPVIIAAYPEVQDYLRIVIKPETKPILISLLTSTAIGVIFGYYPAKRAAKMDPIDALRFDG